MSILLQQLDKRGGKLPLAPQEKMEPPKTPYCLKPCQKLLWPRFPCLQVFVPAKIQYGILCIIIIPVLPLLVWPLSDGKCLGNVQRTWRASNTRHTLVELAAEAASSYPLFSFFSYRMLKFLSKILMENYNKILVLEGNLVIRWGNWRGKLVI